MQGTEGEVMKRIVFALSALAFAATVLPASARAQAPKEVSLAVLAPSALLWVHAAAESQGFYAKRGIEIRELRASDSPALLQAVSTGSADAGVSLGDLVVRAVDKGAPVVIAGSILDKTILRLYGAEGVAGIGDLAGKNLTAGAVRGGTANLLKYQLQQGGVDPAGVQMVSIANSRDRIVAMGNGQVAGALLIAPFDTLAEREGAKLLDVYREPYVQTPLILNRAWAEKNREAAEGLAQAMAEAATWLNEPANKQAAIDVLAEYTNSDPEICAASYAFIIEEQKAIPRNLALTAAGLENLYRIDAAVGGEPASDLPFEIGRYYDPSFVGEP